MLAAYDEAFSLLGHGDPESGMLASFSWTPSVPAGIDGNISTPVTFVPEPSGTLLAGIGLAAIALALRRRRRPVGRPAPDIGLAT